MKLKDILNKKGKQYLQEDKFIKPWHSSFYHDQYMGWSEYYVPKENGKGKKLLRVYTGKYYRQDLSDKERKRIRFLYSVLYFVAVSSYIIGATIKVESNMTWYVTLPQAVSVPFLFWFLLALINYIPAGPDLKEGEYRKAVQWLHISTLVSAICLFLSTLSTLIFVFLHLSDFDWQVLLAFALLLISGIAALAVNRKEYAINYLVIDNEIPEPPGSFKM